MLTDRLLAFEHLDEAWPKGRTAIERADLGRRREDALSKIATLRNRIARGRAATLADPLAALLASRAPCAAAIHPASCW